MASKRERERQEKRKAGKVSYDLPPEVKQTIADLAPLLIDPYPQ